MSTRPVRLIFDLETTAIGVKPAVIHILVIADVDTGQMWTFRKNEFEDNIREGIAMLNEADVLIGHNAVGFDCPVLWEVYPSDFNPKGTFRDTMVSARMVFANVKDHDFKLWKQEKLPGEYIGSMELAAWGYRFGLHKGDYMDKRLEELKAEFPESTKEERMIMCWATWNQEMEDYAGRDVEITLELWKKIEGKRWSEEATLLEHRVHDEMERVKRNGFPLDLIAARELESQLRDKHKILSDIAIEHFGKWWAPQKWKGDESTTYVLPNTGISMKDQIPFKPREAFGEDESREYWGEVTVPKRTTKFKDILRGDVDQGCPFCPVEIIEFNPNSRQQIVTRLQKMYGWEPQEFTEKGSAVVNDEVLRELAHTIPICDELAEIFYYKKRLGQLVDGQNGLIGKAEEHGDGKIHARINVGGTVTNRASHSSPNIAQVPRVVFKNLKQWQEEGVEYDFAKGKIVYGKQNSKGIFVQNDNLTPLIDPMTGNQIIGKPVMKDGEYVRDDNGVIKVKKSLLKQRAGDHGWDFRNLFYVPDGWQLMGADQKGIELRCLGHFMAEFDGGAYLKLVVESDPHDLHQQVMELDNRDTAKTFIYAMIYGAQPYKLGITIDPMLANYPNRAKALGTEMQRRIMTRIPALGSVIKSVQREAKRNNTLVALDGRQLYVRGQHSALNTKLQAAAATIAKKWCILFEEMCEDAGLKNGWDGDFAILAWVHDELQTAVRDDPVVLQQVQQFCIDAALEAGRAFNFACEVNIDTKFGRRWSQTH